MAEPAPPSPIEGMHGKGKREGGCTLIVRDLETPFMGLPGGSDYLSVTDSKDEAAQKVNDARKNDVLVKFERNDYTVYSGQEVWIDPHMVVSVS
jgi:hypothetical protein